MRSPTVIAALLTSFCWSSGSNTAEVAPGEDAVLSCRKVLPKREMFWSRLAVDRDYSCVASNAANVCSGIKNDRFKMSFNKSFASLTIKDVKMEDGGFYFCGFNVFGKGEIHVVQLIVEEPKTNDDDPTPDHEDKSSCESNCWISAALGGLCFLLLMVVVGFALKVKKLQKAQSQDQNVPNENPADENLNYAAVSFQPKARATRRAFHHEPNVVYAATR